MRTMDRISLSNTAFEGNNNAYLLRSNGTTAMVDTGDATDETRDHLETELADRGLGFADIDLVFLTHFHGDHTGLAATIQDESGATVYAHEDDAALISQEPETQEAMEQKQLAYFDEWAIPEDQQAVLRSIMHGEGDMFGAGPEVEPFADGDSFQVGDYELTARHTPGHALGLASFELTVDGEDVVASGDALLPVYTPNVGGADIRVEGALGKYLETLIGYIEADYDRAWPGHRDPIEDPAARAETIVDHHEERAWRVLEVLREQGPSTPWAVSAELFGDLESIHILHGPGESYAHLEHLEADGYVEQDGKAYALTDAARERMAAVDDDRWPLVDESYEQTL
jgi:glyoxylase-like metal-dependent hydrolase (beta-lactamase superfamily II)